jgi:hypothetical protein
MSNQDNILSELKSISNTLFSIKSNEKELDIPADYFNHFYHQISSKIELHGNENLNKINKKSIDIPDNYFEHFADTILDRVKKKEITSNTKTIERNLFSYLKILAIAASIIGVLTFISIKIIQLNNINTEEDCFNTFACLSADEIKSYVKENTHVFQSEEVYTIFEQDINENNNYTEQNLVEKNDENITKFIEENPSSLNDLIDNESDYIF